MKNVYEMYKNNELPEKLKLKIENRQSFCKTEEENIKSGATFSYATPIKKKC